MAYNLKEIKKAREEGKYVLGGDKERYFILTDEEKYQAMGLLNDKQLKAYSDFRLEGLKHKTALELAKDF